MLKISDRVEAGYPEEGPGRDQHPRAGGQSRQHRRDPERRGSDEQEPAAADAVAERAHRDQ
jgi:hypothetical protein